ncbi:MAG: guanylate kinase [Lachnospiraceae bacterium]|nr:guanylate kinase [Lachnospiraceae bacterium]
MANIFVIIGKSSTGKDTVYRELLTDRSLELKNYVSYTTRPMRDGERDGSEYHFVSDEEYLKYRKNKEIIEERCYNTIMGDWHYFTADDGSFEADEDIIMTGTLESYSSLKAYFGIEKVKPVFIDCADRSRLMRAIAREDKREIPQYKEMCRRFVSDSDDFSEEKIKECGIERIFINEDLKKCVSDISDFIRNEQKLNAD